MKPLFEIAPSADSLHTPINFYALRNAPNKLDYENSLAHSYYTVIRTRGRKIIIGACILALPLLFAGQLQMVINLPLWAKIWIIGIIICMFTLTVLTVFLPRF